MGTDDHRTYADPLEEVGDPAPQGSSQPRYTLGELLGTGGMGEVRAATDTVLEREVAIKLLREDRAGERARFLREARITAALQHPNIVPVHDLGQAEDGRPYLAMKRVQGRSLAELLTHGQLGPTSQRLEIFRKLCDAVAFAHKNGVLHRDLKPDNIMVGELGEVLLMDWGIATSWDPARPEDVPGGLIGTPAYMAPEQARGERCTARSDVYSLGAVLYELVTGSPPYQGGVFTVLDAVRAGQLAPPRQRNPKVSPELERVMLHAMAHRPEDRYPSALALRQDIDAVLERQPLVHLRSTPLERLTKWADRHRGAVRATAAATAVGLLALALGSWRYAVDVGEARDEAVEAAARARAAEQGAVAGQVAAEVALADALGGQGQVLEAEGHLRAADALLEGRALDRRALDLAWSQHLADNSPPISRCQPHGGRRVLALDLGADGRSALSWGEDGRLVRWDPLDCAERSAERLGAKPGPGAVDARRGRAAVVVDGALIVSDGSARRQVAAPEGARAVGLDGNRVWVRDGEARIFVLSPGEDALRPAEAPAVGAALWRPALGGQLWLADSTRTGGEPGGVWRAADGAALLQESGVNSVATSSDGRVVLLGTATERSLRFLDGGPGISIAQEPVNAVGVAPGDRVGWAQGFDGSVRVLSLDDGAQLAAYVGPGDLPSAIAVTEDARLLAISGGAGEVLLYLRPAWPARHPPQTNREVTHGLALGDGGRLLLLGDDDGRITLLDAATARPLRGWRGYPTGVRQVAFSPDARRIAAAARYDGLVIVDLERGEPRLISTPARTVSVAWLPAGLFTVDVEGRLLRLDPDTGALTTLGQGLHAASWALAAVGEDRLLTAGHMGEETGLALLSASGEVLRRFPLDQIGYQVAVSPDGRRAAVGGHRGQAVVFDLESGQELRRLEADAGPTLGVAFSPDGSLLATTGYSRDVKLWDLATGALLRAVHQHDGPGLNLLFSPDGSALYSTATDGWSVLPLDARARHEAAVATLARGGPGRAAALAALGWWERVEEVADASLEDRRNVATARLALGQPPLAGDGDLYLGLLGRRE